MFQTKKPSDVNPKSKMSDKIQIDDRDFNIKITLPYKQISSYDAYKDNVYMSAADKSPSGMANKIIQYNRKTKKTATLFTTKFSSSSVQGVKANNQWVTWVDSDDFGGQINLYVMNTKTRKVEPVTKENDQSIRNEFPVLAANHLAWIYHDEKKKKSFVVVRDLNTHHNKIIFNLRTPTLENAFLSIQGGKLLFTDISGGKGYCYLYDILNQKLEKFPSPYGKIGWGELLNNHQFIYLAFHGNSFSDNKLVLYDTKTKKTREFPSKIREVTRLGVDTNNHIFVSTGSDNYFQKYQIKNGNIEGIGKINESDIFNITANNGVYLMKVEKRNGEEKLIITTKLPK